MREYGLSADNYGMAALLAVQKYKPWLVSKSYVCVFVDPVCISLWRVHANTSMVIVPVSHVSPNESGISSLYF